MSVVTCLKSPLYFTVGIFLSIIMSYTNILMVLLELN